MLRNLTAEEDLLFLLPERERPEATHAVLADHAARKIGSCLNVAAGPCRHLVEEYLLGHTATVRCRQPRFQVLARVIMAIVRQIDRDTQRHTARNDGDLVDRVRVVANERDQ